MTDKLKNFLSRDLSWSSISSFEYDKEKWYDKYANGIIEPQSAQMEFGNIVGKKLAEDLTFLPEVPRYSVFEKKLKANIGDVNLVGYLDTFCPDTFCFNEYKTSSNDRKWTKKSSKEHGQNKFYNFLIYKNYGIIPEKIKGRLVYIPVEQGQDFQMMLSDKPIQIFEVNYTTTEILKFMMFVKKKYQEMIKYIESRG